MARTARPFAAGLLIAAWAILPARGEEGSSPAAIRGAIERALPLIQKGAMGYIEQRTCFSCHHQALPMLALTLAKARGLPVDAEVIEEQARHTEADLAGAIEAYRTKQGQPGGVTRAGYALWTLEQGGRAPNVTTGAVTEFLLQRDRDRDHWPTSPGRPPSEASSFTSTYLALRALGTFATAAQKERVEARRHRVREWLEHTEGKDTEDRVFRLWGLSAAGAGAGASRSAAEQLRTTQRPDGGWAQLDDGSSDAYATGSALVALHQASGLSTEDPSYRRGLAFLIAHQEPDGSWHVRSRSRPFQTYFESGFPHEKDQFISIAGSSWATAALVLACPPPP
jgi:hypothetical protein